jgi:hypothetical protein
MGEPTIPSNFSSPFFSPIGDRFYNLNGLAKNLQKIPEIK